MIGVLWKESDTSCPHLPQTHAVIQLWRALLDELAPGALLLTATNVPHAENVGYFGDGSDEANLVYQFALPPLMLHAFASGSAALTPNDSQDALDLTTGCSPCAAAGGSDPGLRDERDRPDRAKPGLAGVDVISDLQLKAVILEPYGFAWVQTA